MTGNELAQWMHEKNISKVGFERLGGPTANTTRALISRGDLPVPDWVKRICFWISLPEELRASLWNTYVVKSNG